MTAIGIFITSISVDESTQARAYIDDEVVADYADALSDGAHFPPVIVFHDGEHHWLADGFHRFHAHKRARRESILAEVRDGDRRRAVLYACGANAEHGMRRTNADKRRAVETLLGDAEWRQWSDRQIAKVCRVAHSFVGKVRADYLDSSPDGTPERKFERNGATSTMNTANINSRRTMTDAQRARNSAEELAQREHDEAYDFTDEEIAKLHLETVDENEELRARVAQLEASDLGAEVAKERAARKCAEERMGELMTQLHEMNKDLRRYIAGFKELRALAGTKTNDEALRVIRKMFKASRQPIDSQAARETTEASDAALVPQT